MQINSTPRIILLLLLLGGGGGVYPQSPNTLLLLYQVGLLNNMELALGKTAVTIRERLQLVKGEVDRVLMDEQKLHFMVCARKRCPLRCRTAYRSHWTGIARSVSKGATVAKRKQPETAHPT